MTAAIPPRRRQAERRATAAWWGVLALLVQILVPLGQAVPVAGTDGLPRALVLCSATAPQRTVPLPGSAGPVSADTRNCAVCLAYACGAGADLPVLAELQVPPTGAARPFGRRPVSLARGIAPGLPQSRGPPVV